MTYRQQLLDQLARAESHVRSLPVGIRESHPVLQDVERRFGSDREPQGQRSPEAVSEPITTPGESDESKG